MFATALVLQSIGHKLPCSKYAYRQRERWQIVLAFEILVLLFDEKTKLRQ